MFFIVDENNDFQRMHPRWFAPCGVYMDNPMSYALAFLTRAEADNMLAAWASNNDFTGRVIDRAEAEKLDAVYA